MPVPSNKSKKKAVGSTYNKDENFFPGAGTENIKMEYAEVYGLSRGEVGEMTPEDLQAYIKSKQHAEQESRPEVKKVVEINAANIRKKYKKKSIGRK